MSDRQLDEERIFHVARQIESAEVRNEYLTQICAGDQALQERVEALLAAFQNEQSLLKSKFTDESTVDLAHQLQADGDTIGRYKLLQKIGEGGFGVVYMAEQSHPVRRKVALKLIKPGMDTKAVVARFEAERQALALMDHENIAKVLDGGATPSGRPYFVMELVRGVPLTEFCDENKLDLRERLGLFHTVCRAIQHAHQKGIIHRDIKPSNVLVTLHDGIPFPKIIDFGISKAISQQLTDKTLFTAHGQMVGTPQYMSPEQAEMSGLDIDTRTDVYSLGILLYELLTGSTPLDPARLRSTAYAELQRLIREEEPIQPSRRCSTMGDRSVTIAARRQSDPRKLGMQLRGELDWIVMKALEKDRNRRYESANSLAADVQRYLDGEVVQACPPSSAYRLQKFAQKHRSLIWTAGLIAVVLVMASLVSTSLAVRYRNNWIKLQTVIDKLNQAAINRACLAASIGNIDQAKQEIEQAELDENRRRAYLEMVDGLEAMLAGNPAVGADYLKSATKRVPDDVILQAIRAELDLISGDWESYANSAVAQDLVAAKTDYERIFVGQALCWTNTKRSLELLDEAVDNQRHPLAYMYRSRSRATHAGITRDTDLMEGALRDVNRAADSLPENKMVRVLRMEIHMYAYDLFAKQPGGDEDDSRAAQILASAQRIAADLEDEPLLGSACRNMGYFYKLTGEQEKSREMYAQTRLGRAPLFAFAMEPGLTSEEADEILQSLGSTVYGNDRSIVYRYIILRDQHRDAEAESLVKEHLSNAGDNPEGWAIDLALISGNTDLARQLAKQILASFPEDAYGIRPSFLRFHASEGRAADIQEYLRNAPTVALPGAHSIVGKYLIAHGRREEALEQFRIASDISLFVDEARAYSDAMKKRIEADQSWPHWLPQQPTD